MQLRVLIVEDSIDDATLLLRELRRSGYDVTYERVENAVTMRAALEAREWDVVLSDYSMPQFSAPEALKLLQENRFDLPFIIISGTVGEDAAVVALKAGAHDFFAKGRLARLIPAIEREMREAAMRQARRQAEAALQQSTERLRILHAIDRAILTAQSSEAIIQIGLRYFVQQRAAPGAAIVAFNFETKIGQVLAVQGAGEDGVPVGKRFALDEWSAEDLEALRTNEDMIIELTATTAYLPPGISALGDTGLGTFLRVPLIVQDELIGILDLGADQPSDFTTEYRATAREIASQLAIAMQQERFREQIQRHALELEQRVEERTIELQRTKKRVEAILNNSSDAILFLNFDGIIQQVNPAYNELFNNANEEILGESLLSLAHPDSREPLQNALIAARNTGQSSRTDFLAMRRDGSLFNADMGLAVIREGETIRGLVCGVRDITGRKQMEAELLNALEKERELNELKSRFVSIVSHEFRTPLTAIFSSSQLLQTYSDRMTDEKKQSHLDKIGVQITRLTEMLDDVLTLSRVDTVGIEFNPFPFNLVNFCRDLSEEIQGITNTPHQIVFSVAGDCTEFIGDEKLLRQIVTNLLTNAVKYSPDGGEVEFHLHCEERQTVIQVRDNGLGIPEEDQKHLFEPFHRAKNVGEIQGTGLGLPIVKRAVEAHGGTIVCKSEVGKGTTFTITIPYLT